MMTFRTLQYFQQVAIGQLRLGNSAGLCSCQLAPSAKASLEIPLQMALLS